MKNRISTNSIWYIIAGFFAIHMLNIPFSASPMLIDKGPSWLGLDASWFMTINYALLNNWTWGEDIQFTYGPLGFLSTRNGLGISLWTFIVFDLFIIANFFFVFLDFIKKANNTRFLSILTLLCITLLLKPHLNSDLSWLLLFFIYYWLFKSSENEKWAYFIMISILVVILFYVKLNTGLIGICLYFAFLSLQVLTKKIKPIKAFLALLLPFFLILSTSFFLRVNLVPYLTGAIELIRGYNEIMYLNEVHDTEENQISIIFFSLLTLNILSAIYLFKRKHFFELFFIAINILYLFLLRKQCILRNDIQHLQTFILFAPLILLHSPSLLFFEKPKNYFSYASLVIVLTCLLFAARKTPVEEMVKTRYIDLLPQYLSSVKNYKDNNYFTQSNKRFIPDHVLSKIGKKTIDIFPWDSEYLLENKLNYKPRPVFQSLATYTENLQKLNYNFYVKNSPEFVIYDYDAIDNRYPFNDEGILNLFLTKNYAIADTFTSNERWRLLLQRKATISPINLKSIKEETIPITEEISPGRASILKIDLKYNLKGRLKSLWSKPPVVNVELLTSDGQPYFFKSSIELLKAGIMTQRFISGTKDFSLFMQNRNQLMDIEEVRLSIDTSYFHPTMNITYLDDSEGERLRESSISEKISFVRFDILSTRDAKGNLSIPIWHGEILSRSILLSSGKYNLVINSSGTPVSGTFPHIVVYINGNKLGDFNTNETTSVTNFNFEVKGDEKIKIKLLMDNDEYHPERKEDRNAFIQKIFISKTD